MDKVETKTFAMAQVAAKGLQYWILTAVAQINHLSKLQCLLKHNDFAGEPTRQQQNHISIFWTLEISSQQGSK